MIGIMEKGKKIPPQEASQTNPVAKPEDTKGGINNMVSSGLKGAKLASGLIGKKLAEQAEENEEMPSRKIQTKSIADGNRRLRRIWVWW
jgi:hypothetical protein